MNHFQIAALINKTMREQGVNRLTAKLAVFATLSEDEVEAYLS